MSKEKKKENCIRDSHEKNKYFLFFFLHNKKDRKWVLMDRFIRNFLAKWNLTANHLIYHAKAIRFEETKNN
jgi:hypothetical protein